MLKKSKVWAELIRVGHLSPEEAWSSMNHSILKALEYPLPALTLTEKHCRNILTPIINAGFPASGINRNFPLAIRNGPKEYGGFEVRNLFLKMGSQRIQYLESTSGRIPRRASSLDPIWKPSHWKRA